MIQPLSSLKILDFSALLPGPFATMLLADLGADVLRVEAPDRPDLVRYLPPFDGETSAWHGVLNRNKRSLALDLKQPGAVAVVKRLVDAAGGDYDIILEQFRPGVMERLGIDYETLRAVNPRLIFCSLTGYGQTGPYRERAGHDINYLALSGAAGHSGRAETGPPPLGVQVADIGGSFGAITGILTAVIQRYESGAGQQVDISMFDLMLAWQSHIAANYLVGDEPPAREEEPLNGGRAYDYYRTKDGRFLAVGALEPKFWQGFCEAIGRPDLAGRGVRPNLAEQQAVKGEVRAVIEEKTLAAWTAVFAERDVCVEPVLTLPEALDHPQAKARGMVVVVPNAEGGAQRQIASPFKFSAARPTYRHAGVPLGAYTNKILAEIGYDEAEIQTLRAQGIFGTD